MPAPANYVRLPNGIRCKCLNLWTDDRDGSLWCCNRGGVVEELVTPTQDLDALITDDVVMAALRGWCGAPRDHVFSNYQQAPETKAAWRKAIKAALVELGIGK